MSNIDIKVTAEVIDLQAKMELARGAVTKAAAEARAAFKGVDFGKDISPGALQAAESLAKTRLAAKEVGAELKAAQGGASVFTEGLSTLNSVLGPLGLALSAGAVLSFAKDLEEGAAHIEHEAEVLELSSVALQDFTESAKRSGVETEAVETSIRRFVAALGQAKEKSGAQRDAFEELKVSWHGAAQDTLPEVARALLNMDDATKRAELSRVIFARGGQEMIPAFKEWAKGTDELTAELDKMGLLLSPETTKAAKDADIALSEAFDRMKVSMTPAVVDLTNKLAGLVDWLQKVDKNAPLHFLVADDDVNIPKVKAPPHPPKPTAAQIEKQDVDALGSYDAKLEEREKITTDLTAAEKALHEAENLGDTSGIKKASVAVDDLKKKLAELNKPENAFKGTGFANAGAEAISQARAQLDQEVAVQRAGSLEKAQLEEQTWQRVLSTAKLNAAQKLDVEKNLAQATAAVEREKATIASQQANTDVELARIAYEQKKALLDQDVAAHRITQEQEDSELIAALRAIEAREIASVDVKAALYKDDLANFQRAEEEKALIAARTQAEIDRIVAESTKTQEKQGFDLQKELEKADDEFVRGVFAGRQKLGSLLLSIGEKIAEDWISAQLKQLTATIATEGAKTAAVTAGAQVRLVEQAAADEEGSALSASSGQKQILQDAAKAASGAYAAVAGIPYVGPILAPIAAAGAFVAVEAFENLASFDIGTNLVPRDMPAIVHAGERIVPAADNRALIEALGSGGGRAGGGDIHLHMNPTFHAPQDFRSMARDQGRQILEFIRQAMRDGYLPQGQ